jgi:hypothetical protein
VGLRQNQVYLAALNGTGGRRLHHSTTFSPAAAAVVSIQQIIYCLLSPTVFMMTSDSRDMMSTKSYCTSFVFRHVFLNKIGVHWQQARGQPTIVETEMR